MYFKNKFNPEFLTLSNMQTPRGGHEKIGDHSSIFFHIEKNKDDPTVKVIPLLLFNRLNSSNSSDRNIEDYMMLCDDNADTEVTAIYDERYTRKSDKFMCNLNVNDTGDFKED